MHMHMHMHMHMYMYIVEHDHSCILYIIDLEEIRHTLGGYQLQYIYIHVNVPAAMAFCDSIISWLSMAHSILCCHTYTCMYTYMHMYVHVALYLPLIFAPCMCVQVCDILPLHGVLQPGETQHVGAAPRPATCSRS